MEQDEGGGRSFTDFLIKLSEASELLAAFRDDPDRVMSEHGLTENQRALLRSGDEDKIRAEAVRETGLRWGDDVMNVAMPEMFIAAHGHDRDDEKDDRRDAHDRD